MSTASDDSSLVRRPRVDVLDVLRGVAILGIFLINIQIMVGPPWSIAGGKPAHEPDWAMGGPIGLLVDGTQRGMLQMLFGAGMLLLTARGARPDGPISVADDFFRRNLWLLAIGLIHVFVVGWAYDVVHVYAISALFLFPFRRLRPAAALMLGLSFAGLTLFGIVPGFDASPGPKGIAEGVATGALARDRAVAMWLGAYEGFGLWRCVLESLGAMLVGVALFKWGVTQGGRSRSFYLMLAASAYVIGCTVRLVLRPGAEPGFLEGWDFAEVGRLSMTVGHVAAINLAWKTPAGRWLLGPFKAAGRTALSLYFMQSFVGLWAFASLPGPDRGVWLENDHLTATAAVVGIVLLATANLWLVFFRCGPLEWAWHRLIDLGRSSAVGQDPLDAGRAATTNPAEVARPAARLPEDRGLSLAGATDARPQ